MRRIEQTLVISSLLAVACSGEVGESDMPDGLVGSAMPSSMAPVGTTNPVANGSTTATSGAVTPPNGTDGTPMATVPAAMTSPPGDTSTPMASAVPTMDASTCAPGVPESSQIPRLTNAQYERTVYDLLGTGSPGLLATEQEGAMTKSVWEGYQLSADSLAATVMLDATLKSKFMKCTPAGDGTDCLKATIQEFGRRAYRRPLSAEETAGFDAMLAKRADITAGNTVDQVAELVLSTFLKSPGFLQRAELVETPNAAGGFSLSSHEVAARLSYMLWGTMPDEILDAAADEDQLLTKDQVLAQATRMAADPKARDVAAEFHRIYLDLHGGSRWDTARKDATDFPNFSETVVLDMINETEMLFDNVFTTGGGFQDLLTTNKAYVTSRTAALYGLANPMQYGETPTETTLDASRPGFLTRIGFLAAYSKETRTSPILRGAFVTKRVLGVDPGDPDPNVANTALPTDPALDTNRKRVEVQTAPDGCAGCHSGYVNPPGFVLEAFDTTGATQTTELSTQAPIDTAAEIRFVYGGTPVPVTGPADFMAKIAASPEAQRFYASRWVGHAYERSLTPPDVCVVDAVAAKITVGGYSIQNLLTDLTQADSFLTRSLEVTP